MRWRWCISAGFIATILLINWKERLRHSRLFSVFEHVDPVETEAPEHIAHVWCICGWWSWYSSFSFFTVSSRSAGVGWSWKPLRLLQIPTQSTVQRGYCCVHYKSSSSVFQIQGSRLVLGRWSTAISSMLCIEIWSQRTSCLLVEFMYSHLFSLIHRMMRSLSNWQISVGPSKHRARLEALSPPFAPPTVAPSTIWRRSWPINSSTTWGWSPGPVCSFLGDEPP